MINSAKGELSQKMTLDLYTQRREIKEEMRKHAANQNNQISACSIFGFILLVILLHSMLIDNLSKKFVTRKMLDELPVNLLVDKIEARTQYLIKRMNKMKF